MSIIVDNTVLTNFALIKREDILTTVFKDKLFTTEEVLKELHEGEKKGILPQRDWSKLKMLNMESEDEKRTFEIISQKLGVGESSCLAIAIHKNFNVLTDDLDARRYAQRRRIAVSGTIGVFVQAVRKKIITLQEANNLVLELIKYGYFSPFEKLDELL